MAPTLEPMVGRYLRLDIDGGRTASISRRPAQGIPLVCLHTAGADGRQYRHLLDDPEITSRFRVLAFDMPWHGKSTPPDGWEKTEYRLTTASYTAAILAFCAALELDRPVVMGCSIGGRIVLNLAIAHAAEFRALIGARGRRLPAALVRHRLAAPARRPRRRGLRRAGLRPDRAAKPGGSRARDAVDVHAGRPRRVQGRPLFLSRRRRPAREGEADRHQGLSALSADRRIRFLLHARGHAAHGGADPGRRGARS